MNRFLGQEKASIDSSGRLKLPSVYYSLFDEGGVGELILYCLPEGAVGIYPIETWKEIRELEEAQKKLAAHSFVHRRQMRQFGAMSQQVSLSKQGRITIPALFREFASIDNSEPIILAGVEIGLEIWNADRWKAEMLDIQNHYNTKASQEMNLDLTGMGYEEN